MLRLLLVFCYFLLIQSFTASAQLDPLSIKTGAEQTELYLPLLKNKKIAVLGNHTSMIGGTHLVDSLLALKVNIKKVFCPEHGFRGTADAGETVKNYKDKKTNLPIISLYGSHKKHKASDLKNIDLVVFDMQDVGARFYTYISTMHYVMEACAENGVEFLILDKPNPNGHYVDGPVLKPEYKSFVGLHPVPIVHGMTVGEYAMMINEQGWLQNKVKCKLSVIRCSGYDHKTFYRLKVKPSPNLAEMNAIYLYPSLCLFEGTIVSVGRGTPKPFQWIGYPEYSSGNFSFTPVSVPGASKNPPYENKVCKGFDLTVKSEEDERNNAKFTLEWLKKLYDNAPDKSVFFNNYFNSLAGNAELKQQIIEGKSEDEIRKSWQKDLDEFKLVRKKYLLYPDSE